MAISLFNNFSTINNSTLEHYSASGRHFKNNLEVFIHLNSFNFQNIKTELQNV